jgi:hypothetical protein
MSEGGVPKSHGISGEGGRGGVCDFAGYLARSGRVAYLYLALCCYGGSVELSCPLPPPLEWSLHAPFIVSRRCRVTWCWCLVCPCRWRSLEASEGPYLVVAWSALWRHGVGTSGTAATCSGACATAEGVVSVFLHCSDVLCHAWSYTRRGVFVLVVWPGVELRGLRAEASGEPEVFRDPSEWGLGWSGDMGWLAHAFCWRPSKGEFSPLLLHWCIPLNGVGVVFHHNLDTPNCGTRHHCFYSGQALLFCFLMLGFRDNLCDNYCPKSQSMFPHC